MSAPHANPVAWGVWGIAVALVTITTRNPLYLVTALLATSIVYLARSSRAPDTTAWSLVVKIGTVVAGVSVLFNLLTVHAGDRVLFRITGAIPIVSGDITTNALVYGLSSAFAILTLILAAATFGSIVDRASLLRVVPYPLSSAGVAAIIGLSFFPQMIAAIRDVREAQSARGFRVRSVRDIAPLVVPTLFLGLERAFNLAETLETRGFGGSTAAQPRRSWPLPLGIVLLLASISVLIGGLILPAIALGLGGTGIVAFGLFGSRVPRVAYRPVVWTIADWLVIVTAGFSAACFSGALFIAPASLEWSAFPELIAPPFAPLLGIACVLLAVPALVGGDAP